MNKVDIAILGLGTVGQGTVKIIEKNRAQWVNKCGADINIKKVLVRNLKRAREVDLPEGVVTDQWSEIIADPDIKIVIEVMGGIEPAKTYIMEAIKKGKNIVTANKDLLAEYGQEVFEAAKLAGVDIYFEASVAGGIPIIMPLKRSLVANNITQVMGIVNGTTNYILTKMSNEGMDYDEASHAA
ncbi:MAG: homoserine dehydrogenase, partial [Desulfocucumaceae bacterium]